MKAVKNPKLKPRSSYDWEKLTNGEWWELTVGVGCEVQTSLKSFRVGAIKQGNKRGLKASVRCDPDKKNVIYVRFTKNDKAKAPNAVKARKTK